MDKTQNTANYNNQYKNNNNYNSNNKGNYQRNSNNNYNRYQNNNNNQGSNEGVSGGPQVQNLNQLKNINFELTELYFPIFVIQIRYDIFPLRNRNYRNYQGNSNYNQNNQNNQDIDVTGFEEAGDDEYMLYQEYQRQSYETQCKIFFILRDQFLLTKVQITGVVVFLIKKEEKFFFGIDDSTGVMTCVLWLNDYNNQGGQSGKRQQEMRAWFSENEISIGSCISVLGGLEYFQDKLQLNAYKMRLINNTNEEMLQYQHTISSQKCFFDPIKPFQRRLFNKDFQPAAAVANEYQMITEAANQDAQNKVAAEVILSSYKRVKKRINDYIMNNYNELFKISQVGEGMDTEADEGSPKANAQTASNNKNQTADQQDKFIVAEDILTNPKLVQKVQEELSLCEEKDKNVRVVIQECLAELEEKGFVNITGDTVQRYLLQFSKQKKNLRLFISNELSQAQGKGVTFDTICKKVMKQYDNFYTKEFIFKSIDELFQLGLIIETGKHTYSYLGQI